MAEFLDANLSPRARDMALWLCDLTDDRQQRMFRDASRELLLRELPDHWTAEDLTAMSAELRATIGRGGSRRAWLTGANWLVGADERLPPRERYAMSAHARLEAQRLVRDLLTTMAAR